MTIDKNMNLILKQRKKESVLDYIERLRNLILSYKEKISEVFYIDMCVQGM
jgi:hypothetical protein